MFRARIDAALLRECVEAILAVVDEARLKIGEDCLLYTSPSPRDRTRSRMPSSA